MVKKGTAVLIHGPNWRPVPFGNGGSMIIWRNYLALLKLKGLSIFQLISLFRLIQTLRRNGRFSFNTNQTNNLSSLSVSESYKILNLDEKKKLTKEDINKAYLKIQKKIHPDVSPETARLSSIVNEARDVLLNEVK